MTTRPAARRQMTLMPLIAATYFMVAGGPYGLEELVAKQGYDRALLILAVMPIVWSLPTALMVGELAAAVPDEGGYYAWVRRACGPFWGFQEAWLSLAASVFDMAIYPTLFTLYLGRLFPPLAHGWPAIAAGVVMVAACAAWNLTGARGVGLASLLLTVALLGPFAVMSLLAPLSSGTGTGTGTGTGMGASVVAGMLVAMWNYMGWDNASTVAGEVHRPQRTYPLAMLGTVVAVTLTYMIPVYAARRAGIDPSGWDTGAWVDAAGSIGGRWLGWAVVVGGVVCAVGMFNALVMSYSRLPMVLAEDGFLPRAFSRTNRRGAPWVAIVACAVAYAACLGLGFDRLVELDVVLYGLALGLEYVALIVLRVREPRLERPFRLPGGLAGAVAIAVPPMALLVVAAVAGREEQAGSRSALTLAAAVVSAGPLVYWLSRRLRST